jgi:fluoride exporter
VSLVVVLVVGVVGGIGAIGRFVLDGAVAARVGRRFPLGTLAINLSGSLLLGVLVGAAVRGDAYEVVGTGLLGAYTTFSTWAYESHRLGEDGQLRLGGLNFALSLALGVAAAWAGRQLGGAL